MSTRVACHHFHQLMVLCPHQLHLTAIRGCFTRLPRDVTLISEVDLRKEGRVDMVIAGWPCQGHSRAGAGILLQGISLRMYLCWETFRTRYWRANIMFVNILEIPFLWMPRTLVLIAIGLDGLRPTFHRY